MHILLVPTGFTSGNYNYYKGIVPETFMETPWLMIPNRYDLLHGYIVEVRDTILEHMRDEFIYIGHLKIIRRL